MLMTPAIGVAVAGTPVPVEWIAPEGCPEQDAAEAAIAEAGGDAARDGERVRGEVSRRRQGFALQVDVIRSDAVLSRTVELAECSAAVEAAALIVAIAYEPGALAEPVDACTDEDGQPLPECA